MMKPLCSSYREIIQRSKPLSTVKAREITLNTTAPGRIKQIAINIELLRLIIIFLDSFHLDPNGAGSTAGSTNNLSAYLRNESTRTLIKDGHQGQDIIAHISFQTHLPQSQATAPSYLILEPHNQLLHTYGVV
jgi:hypothetical protein